ncbi:MAG: Ig-like domain-containing protein [Prevotellaceae bacterium]|jgi:Leucine-rich repeat (LRR) protein|nr:Ig-like domain-containing protein [Prevotellaceae bacterium]
MKKVFFRTAILCLIAGFTLGGCGKDEEKVSVTGVTLSQTSANLFPNDNFKLIAVVSPGNATNQKLLWTSSNPTVASVSDGTVTALTVGEAVITVTTEEGGTTASCTVTVKKMPEIKITVVNNCLIGLVGSGMASIDWGDGSSQTYELSTYGTVSHDYSTVGSRTITISRANITSFSCNHQDITSLDVSKNPALTHLSCFLNQLTSLDLSNNPALTYLDCGNNQLTSLDLSNNPALTEIQCSYNQLTALDLSNNTELLTIRCAGNQLSAAALNLLFLSLHDTTIEGEEKNIYVYSNPGRNDCDMSISRAKGWHAW